jgi:type I restriction enzyme M protein
MAMPTGFDDKVAVVWRVADKLRGHFKPHEYGSVMLPLLVLRRLDAVLEPTKAAVIAKAAELDASDITNPDLILKRTAGQAFYNVSPLSLTTVIADPKNVAANLRTYINAFSPGAVEVLEQYRFEDKISRLDRAGILYQVLGDFVDLDLRPDNVSNEAMGYVFEELLRKFSEMSNETAGEHYTPREVIRLMVNLLFAEDSEALTGPAPIRTIYDPAAGTGGMLTVASDYLAELNDQARVEVFGQELNPETWAIARSDLMIKGSEPERMVLGNSLTEDGWKGRKFDYMLANPPYGVDWKAYSEPIRAEAAQPGGRFDAGLPRISDGSFLFVQHMLSKMKQVEDRPETSWIDGGSRVGIVLSGSPLFSGGAGSGESEIRRWIIENDWLEGIVALPDSMFYNTGINTYVWILTNRKTPDRVGTVTLVDAREMGTKMRKSLGDKRKDLTPQAIAEITRLFSEAPHLVQEADPDVRVRLMANEEFGYARLTVERPLRRFWRVDTGTRALLPEAFQEVLAGLQGTSWATEKSAKTAVSAHAPHLDTKALNTIIKSIGVTHPDAEPVMAKKGGGWEPDPDLRDQENIPLPTGYLAMTNDERAHAVREAAEAHLADEVLPYVPDAWIDHDKTRIGYEIPFTRQFFVYTSPRPVEEIRADIDALESRIQELMRRLAR